MNESVETVKIEKIDDSKDALNNSEKKTLKVNNETQITSLS
jgi:hypothetical protein